MGETSLRLKGFNAFFDEGRLLFGHPLHLFPQGLDLHGFVLLRGEKEEGDAPHRESGESKEPRDKPGAHEANRSRNK